MRALPCAAVLLLVHSSRQRLRPLRFDCRNQDLELVPCRRCPVAYHRRCLPRDLRDSLEKRYWPADFNDEGEGDQARRRFARVGRAAADPRPPPPCPLTRQVGAWRGELADLLQQACLER